MPPMDMPQQQPNNQMPPMDNNMGDVQGDEQFDSNFDAGVEADESNDPKKYIQQLAGKLSQSLRQYNEKLPSADVDLNKYVAGMTNDAAVEGLTPEDVEEIIGKIKSDETNDSEGQEMPQDNMPPMDDGQNMNQSPDMMPPMENKKNKKLTEEITVCIDEIVNDIFSKKNEVINNKVMNKQNFNNRPYSSPIFK